MIPRYYSTSSGSSIAKCFFEFHLYQAKLRLFESVDTKTQIRTNKLVP